MIHNRATLKVSISCVLGLGLLLGLLVLLRTPPAPAMAAAEGTTLATSTHPLEPATAVLTAGSVITVCPGGTCDFAVIQEAVDFAAPGDEIRVATGTYTDVNNYAGLAQILYLTKTVTIRGGYTTTDWTTSDPGANPTTLDGQGRGRGLYVTGDIAPTLEAFRITGGEARGLGGGPDFAAHAGGGVYVHRGAPIIRDSVILRNVANIGGGVYLRESSAQLSGNTIVSNTARYGGGLGASDSPALIRGNTFEDNNASDHGGGLYVRLSQLVVEGNRFAGNTAAKGGGGLCLNRGGGVVAGNSVVSNDTAGYGGGFYIFNSTVQLIGNHITENQARGEWGGGGLSISSGKPRLGQNIIIGNHADERGGGISLYSADAELINTVLADNVAAESGSGVYVWGGTYRFLHTTLAANGAPPGGAAASDDGTALYVQQGSVALTNTILVGHAVGVYAKDGAQVSLESTLLWDNTAPWAGEGTIEHQNDYEEPPRFVDPANGDHDIRTTSGAVDRGVNAGVTIDVNGRPRPIGAGFDLGAHESTGIDLSTSSKSVSPTGVGVGGVTTYTLTLVNTGPLTANQVVLTDPIPISTTYVSGSVRVSGGVVSPNADVLFWSGTVPSGQPVTITFAVTVTAEGVIENVAEVRDEWDTLTVLRAWLNGFRLYLPLITLSR